MNHHLDEIEKVRQEMQDGYPDQDYYPSSTTEDAERINSNGKGIDDVMFWGLVIFCTVLLMASGYFAGSMSCAG